MFNTLLFNIFSFCFLGLMILGIFGGFEMLDSLWQWVTDRILDGISWVIDVTNRV